MKTRKIVMSMFKTQKLKFWMLLLVFLWCTITHLKLEFTGAVSLRLWKVLYFYFLVSINLIWNSRNTQCSEEMEKHKDAFNKTLQQ